MAVNIVKYEGFDGAGAHNSIYRGKYLGDSVTSYQWSVIQDGTFKDLYIGDYWTINNVNWRIAHFDYWLHMGDTECTTHHVVIVPDSNLYNAQMNTSNVTTGAYIGSKMYTSNLATAKSTINNAFGSTHILKHRASLTNAVSNGYANGGAWVDSTVELMSEEMVYGSIEFKNIMNGTVVPYSYTLDYGQLRLFAFNRGLICNRSDWWLRDVVNDTNFARVNYYGNCGSALASYSYGVRPAFGIC